MPGSYLVQRGNHMECDCKYPRLLHIHTPHSPEALVIHVPVHVHLHVLPICYQHTSLVNVTYLSLAFTAACLDGCSYCEDDAQCFLCLDHYGGRYLDPSAIQLPTLETVEINENITETTLVIDKTNPILECIGELCRQLIRTFLLANRAFHNSLSYC